MVKILKNKRKLILISIAFALIIVIAALSYNYIQGRYDTTESDPATSKAAIKAPNFTVLNIDREEVSFNDFIGKPIVINFWASWCGPCVAEMPVFDNLYKELGDDVVFMMINLTDGRNETIATATSFIENSGFVFPVYFDTKYSAATVYGVSSIPATVFIDADGNIKDSYLGKLTESALRSRIQSIYSD